MRLIECFRGFAKDDSGQDLLEYALLVAFIALVAFGAVAAAGTQVNAIFTSIANQLTEHVSPAGGGARQAPATAQFGTLTFFTGAAPMQQVLVAIRRLVRHDEGQDLLEYGLLAVLIAILAIGAVTALGQTITSVFWNNIAQNF